jgi:hypothetical protein
MNFKNFFIHLGSVRKDSDTKKGIKKKPVCLPFWEFKVLEKYSRKRFETLDYTINRIINHFIDYNLNFNKPYKDVEWEEFDLSYLEYYVQNAYYCIGGVFPAYFPIWQSEIVKKYGKIWHTFLLHEDVYDDLLEYCDTFKMENISKAIRVMVRLTLEVDSEVNLIDFDGFFENYNKSKRNFYEKYCDESYFSKNDIEELIKKSQVSEKFKVYLKSISFAYKSKGVLRNLDIGIPNYSVGLSNYLKLMRDENRNEW